MPVPAGSRLGARSFLPLLTVNPLRAVMTLQVRSETSLENRCRATRISASPCMIMELDGAGLMVSYSLEVPTFPEALFRLALVEGLPSLEVPTFPEALFRLALALVEGLPSAGAAEIGRSTDAARLPPG